MEFWTLFSIYFQTNFILFFIRAMVGNLKYMEGYF
jgi:hypothetical protein